MLVLILGLSAAQAPQAKANATGCSYFGSIGPVKGIPTYNGSYCFTVNGSGTVVYGGAGSYSSYGNTCNWNITMEFFDTSGRYYSSINGPLHYGCARTGSDNSINPYARYRPGKVCSTLKTNGARLTSVCHTLY